MVSNVVNQTSCEIILLRGLSNVYDVNPNNRNIWSLGSIWWRQAALRSNGPEVIPAIRFGLTQACSGFELTMVSW